MRIKSKNKQGRKRGISPAKLCAYTKSAHNKTTRLIHQQLDWKQTNTLSHTHTERWPNEYKNRGKNYTFLNVQLAFSLSLFYHCRAFAKKSTRFKRPKMRVLKQKQANERPNKRIIRYFVHLNSWYNTSNKRKIRAETITHMGYIWYVCEWEREIFFISMPKSVVQCFLTTDRLHLAFLES